MYMSVILYDIFVYVVYYSMVSKWLEIKILFITLMNIYCICRIVFCLMCNIVIDTLHRMGYDAKYIINQNIILWIHF